MLPSAIISLTVIHVYGVYAFKTVNEKTVSIALTLKEGTRPGTLVCKMSSGITPKDVPSPLNISNNSLVLRHKLDYEKQRNHLINLTIAIGSSTKTLPVLITVADEYDEPPRIGMLYGACRLSEELPPGTDIGTMFIVTDRDVNDFHHYSLSGNFSEYLDIHPRTGRITMRKKINRDGESGIVVLHGLKVKVTDMGDNSDEKKLVIEIVDVDDNPPRFEEAQYVFNVHPLSKESTIGKLRCSDADVQLYDRKPCNMSIVSGNPDSIFFIKTTVLFARVEDLKKGSVHVLLVKADDSVDENQFVSVIVMIQSKDYKSRKGDNNNQNQNEFSPKFIRPAVKNGRFRTVKVPEDTAPGTVVLDVTAEDEDKGEAGNVSFSFMPYLKSRQSIKRKPNLAAMYFKMDQVSGNLTVAKPLDADKRTGGTKVFSIVIIARDHGQEPKMTRARGKIILVNVNDNAPVMDKSVYKRILTCDDDIRDDLLVLKIKDLDNDIVSAVTVDSESNQRYSVHKKGRNYALRLHSNIDVKNLSDSVDVVTIIASDRKFLAKAKALIIYTPCEPNITTTTLSSRSTITSTPLQTTATSPIPSTFSVVDSSASQNTGKDVSKDDTMITPYVASDNPITFATICQTFSQEETSTTTRQTPTTAKPYVTSPNFRSRMNSVSTSAADHFHVTASGTSTRMPSFCKACRRKPCKTTKTERREIEKPCMFSSEADAKNGTANVVSTIVIATGATAASVTTVAISAVLVKKFVLSKARISSAGEQTQ